ncbi:hypothetical protein BH11MYX4_BH11MYX4_12200 [soil metagenome]
MTRRPRTITLALFDAQYSMSRPSNESTTTFGMCEAMPTHFGLTPPVGDGRHRCAEQRLEHRGAERDPELPRFALEAARERPRCTPVTTARGCRAALTSVICAEG